MKNRQWLAAGLAGTSLALGLLSGCQTWTSGMTLPSGHYMEHPPQFIPKSPPFPLPREVAEQEAAWAATPADGGRLPLPAQVPPGPGGAPAPLPPPPP